MKFLINIFFIIFIHINLFSKETDFLKNLALAEQKNILKIRNFLHENPSLRWEEDDSIDFIIKEIKKINPLTDRKIIIKTHFKGGLVVDLISHKKDQMTLFRADLDALPIEENILNNPISKRKGKMHACGHDIHSAMLLSALKILATNKQKPKYNIRFVWQRAEENPGSYPNPISGGDLLVKENVLDNVSEVYGLHIWQTIKSGVFFSRPNTFFANSARIYMKVETMGGHASQPHKGKNALWIILELRRILKESLSRKKDPVKIVNIEPVICKSGKVTNVMPKKAEMYFSFRNLLTTKERDHLFSYLKNCIEKRAFQLSAKVECKLISGHPTLINKTFFKSRKILQKEKIETKQISPILAGEDFSYYLQKRNGCFWLLGANQKESGPNHSSSFNPDTKIFWKGVWFWLSLAYY